MTRARETKFCVGDCLVDNTTGIQGVVMVVAYYFSGCFHYGIQPRKATDDGKIPDWIWLDESRFTLVESGAVKFDIEGPGTSGPMPVGPPC